MSGCELQICRCSGVWGQQGAEDGQLTVMCGGDPKCFAEIAASAELLC